MTRFALTSLAMLMGAVALSACQEAEPYSLYDPHYAFPSSVERRTAYIDVAPFQTGMPGNSDQIRLSEFLAAYHQQGQAPIAVTVTAPRVTDPLARHDADQIALWLQHQGVAAADIRLFVNESPVQAGPQLTFPIYVMRERDCGNWSKAATDDHDSSNTANFGCATQKNVDAMVANPRDLITARASTGRDGQRAWQIVDNYQKGKPIPGANDIKGDVNYTIGTTSGGN